MVMENLVLILSTLSTLFEVRDKLRKRREERRKGRKRRSTWTKGEAYKSLQYTFRISPSSLSKIIPETCLALYNVLQNQIEIPKTAEGWKNIAKGFEQRWQFPHCVGALDGKHILIKAPAQSGSLFMNYKHNNSIVLLALVDAEYRFLYVDVGCNGRMSDGGIFKRCSLSHAMDEEKLKIPKPEPLRNDVRRDMPYVIVADAAFPLKENIMKPYGGDRGNFTNEQETYNKRLSRARRVVENAFGILANRFRLFHTFINLEPDKVEIVVLACCAIHNYLRNIAIEKGIHDVFVAGDNDDESFMVLPSTMVNLADQRGRNASFAAKDVRDAFCRYFNSKEGSLSWQEE